MSTPEFPNSGWPGQPSPYSPQPPRRKTHRVRNIFIGLGVFVVAIIAIAAALGGSKTPSASQASNTVPATPAAAPSPTDTLSNGQQKFVADMRSQYNIGSSTTDADLAGVGNDICAKASSSGTSQSAVQQAAKSEMTNVSSADAYSIARLAEQDMCPKELPAQRWHTIATFSGSGIENTAQFTIQSANSGNWKLDYTFDCSNAGGTGNFIVDEDNGNDLNGANVNDLSAGRTNSTYVYGDAGTHYLSINSECDWTVKVTQKY